jgi:hypothetical protein
VCVLILIYKGERELFRSYIRRVITRARSGAIIHRGIINFLENACTESGATGGGCARARTKSSKKKVPWNSLAAVESEKEESSGYVIIIRVGKRQCGGRIPQQTVVPAAECVLVLPTYFELLLNGNLLTSAAAGNLSTYSRIAQPSQNLKVKNSVEPRHDYSQGHRVTQDVLNDLRRNI